MVSFMFTNESYSFTCKDRKDSQLIKLLALNVPLIARQDLTLEKRISRILVHNVTNTKGFYYKIRITLIPKWDFLFLE